MIVEVQTVKNPCRTNAAREISFCVVASQPSRQPVMLNDFESPVTMIVLS